MDEVDFDVEQFAHLLETLPQHMPISDAVEQADPQKKGRWWSSQREHMSVWFRSQVADGSGGFTRATANRSAKLTYNRLLHPEGLLWIAEALGAETASVQAAAKEALAITDRRSRSKIVRKHLPWRLISELARKQTEKMSLMSQHRMGRLCSPPTHGSH